MAVGRAHLSVVIPAYNEAERLPRSLPRIGSYMAEQNVDAEVIVVDDGSTDDTAKVAQGALQKFRGRVIRCAENRGKGSAVRRGVLESNARWVLISDADLSSPIEEHAKLASAVRDHDLDVAIGSRGLAESQIEVHQGVLRESMGKTFNRLVRLLTGLGFQDTQCGFKLMHRERVRPLFEKMVVDRFAFDVELLFLCDRFGLKVREIPVVWRNDPHSTVSMFADPPRMLLDVLRVRWRYRRGLYRPERARA